MNVPRFLPALLATLLAAPAWAQSTTQPLNLKLPPGDLPAVSSTAAVPAHDAADYMLALASEMRGGNNDAVFAATLADSAVVWPDLLRLSGQTRVIAAHSPLQGGHFDHHLAGQVGLVAGGVDPRVAVVLARIVAASLAPPLQPIHA